MKDVDMTRIQLKNNLVRLNKNQLKMFYGMLVHYWVKHKFFISKHNFLNLWCELNYLCYEVDESFPDPYDDHKLVKSFCQAHPYYFIDTLAPELVINLFCQYFDDRLDILIQVIDKLDTEGLRAAYACSNDALGLHENIDELVSGTEKWMRDCGGFCQKN